MGALVSKIGFSCRKKKLLGRDPKRTIVKLVRVTNFNESEVKKWMKEFEKDCPDGFLREDEFVAHYSSYFAAGNQRRKEALAKQIFRTFDKDASGCVDFWEFMCGMSALLRGTTVEKLKWAFSMYDLDGNGYICTTELLNVLKSFFFRP
ncbi:HPCAL1 [Branchiostoma lanceolatum]|uniref:HPCAL1 protein n=1 Tax=Branchiostoma lanceolatum TaxID=7740 RepID=A0A8K0F159_BRALA|nr:HPCAL1 [Branchiostoma lanceolatum]